MGLFDRFAGKLLSTPRLMRIPIPLYRAGLGWLLGERLAMIEHRGRSSGEARYVVVEVAERGPRYLRVASGFGDRAQWYRNLRANGVAYLSTGRARRVPVDVRLLSAEESDEALERYARAHPAAWKRLYAAMESAWQGEPRILVVEFTPKSG